MNKNIISVLLIIAILCLGVTASFATKKYSDAPAGQGISTIGTTGDYPSLAAAALDYNTTLNTGNWTMQILNDLVEPSPVAFGNIVNTLNNNTILMTPAPSVNATITFSTTADNPSALLSGQLLIGSTTLSSYVGASVSNFLIDGSNNGTNSRNLTIQNATTFTGFAYIIRASGACPGFTVKNCNLNGIAKGATNHRVIYIDIRKTATGVVWLPTGAQVLNNYIVCTTLVGDNAGVALSNTGTALVNGDPVTNGYVISNNYVLSAYRGIWCAKAGSGTISFNTVQIINTSSAGLSVEGINHSSTQSNIATINIFGNVINKLYSAQSVALAGTGIQGIEMTGNNGTYNCYNNMICGYNYTATSTPGMNYWGLNCDAGATTNYNIYNNSIDMPKMPSLQSGGLYASIMIIGSSGNGAFGTVTVKNNIIRMGQPTGIIFDVGTTIKIFGSINNNTLYGDTANGVIYGQYFGLANSSFTTFAQWTSAFGADVNGQELDPFLTTPSSWISHSNLHFNPYVETASASPMTSAIPVSYITTDIDNETRSLVSPWKGCDELFSLPFATPSTLFGKPENVQTFIAAGGTAPYTWALSTTAIGTLDTLSGPTVNFTAANVTLSATLTLTDSSIPAKTFIVNITVTPTNAPVVNDFTYVPQTQKELLRFDLFN